MDNITSDIGAELQQTRFWSRSVKSESLLQSTQNFTGKIIKHIDW